MIIELRTTILTPRKSEIPQKLPYLRSQTLVFFYFQYQHSIEIVSIRNERNVSNRIKHSKRIFDQNDDFWAENYNQMKSNFSTRKFFGEEVFYQIFIFDSKNTLTLADDFLCSFHDNLVTIWDRWRCEVLLRTFLVWWCYRG